jgi:ketosteroid isomerase-like protein
VVVAEKPAEAPKPAPAEEKPAAKPVEPPKKAVSLGKRPKDVTGSIEYDIRSWATAWAAQDVKAYLAHYGADFKPPKGKKRVAWEEERRDRLSRAEFIRVEISDIKVSHKGGPVAKAKFRQRYQSNILDNTTGKTLVLKKQGEAWKIIGEF